MLINPFYIYIISFGSVFLIYQLSWSYLYPKMSFQVIIFFIFTFIFSFFLGIFINRKKSINFVNVNNKPNVKKYVILIIIFSGIQIILDSQIPIRDVILYSTVDRQYGFPLLYPFLLTFSSFTGVYIYHLFLCEKSKKYLLYFCIVNIPALIFYSRGTLMVTLLTCVFLTLLFYRKKLYTRRIIVIVVVVILIMYIFGYLGNARTYGSSEGIFISGGATEKFKESIIPDEFFWSYIYITSPLANFNYNVQMNNSIKEIDVEEFLLFIIGDFVPDVISNRLLSLLNIETYRPDEILQVHNDLTVSTLYMKSYYVFGWLGPLLTFIYMCILILFFIKILNKTNPFYVTGICFLNTMIGLSFFTNMLGQTSVYAPIIYSVILGMCYKVKIKI